MKSSVAILLALAFAGSASATDRVANGSFNTDLSAWTASGAGISFDAANGAPTAGSLHFVITNATAGQHAQLIQCIDFAPSGAVDLLGSSRVAAESATATTQIRVDAFGATGCAGTLLGTFGGTAVSSEIGTNGIWDRFGFLAGNLPAATQSVSLQLLVGVANAGDSIDVSWDHIQFGEAGTLPVELSSWEVD